MPLTLRNAFSECQHYTTASSAFPCCLSSISGIKLATGEIRHILWSVATYLAGTKFSCFGYSSGWSGTRFLHDVWLFIPLFCLCLCSRVLGVGWRAAIRPADHPVANFDFDVVVGADGRRNTLEGEKRQPRPPGWRFFFSSVKLLLSDKRKEHVVSDHLSQYSVIVWFCVILRDFSNSLTLNTEDVRPACHWHSAPGWPAVELHNSGCLPSTLLQEHACLISKGSMLRPPVQACQVHCQRKWCHSSSQGIVKIVIFFY